MSLVGNLEDLSLGDILQIISLSQKSGVLALESGQGSGRVVFRNGLVQSACVKGRAVDLRDLLVGGGFIDPAGFDGVEARARDADQPLEAVLARETELTAERLATLKQETVEAAVFEMFGWISGDFSFDVRSEFEPGDPQLILSSGLNAQYLAMEGMRLRDESSRADPVACEGQAAPVDTQESVQAATVGEDSEAAEDAFRSLFGDDPLETDELEELGDEPLLASAIGDEFEALPGSEPADSSAAADIVAARVLEQQHEPEPAPERAPTLDGTDGSASTAESAPEQRSTLSIPVVLIDPDVSRLEWTKCAIAEDFARVHVFQQAEQGLSRIRQYLIRGTLPLVLISDDAEIDPLSGIHGLADFVKRLKTQAKRLVVIGLREQPDEGAAGPMPGVLDAVLDRPNPRQRREHSATDAQRSARAFADRVRAVLSGEQGAGASRAGPKDPDATAPQHTEAVAVREAEPAAGVRSLREVTARLAEASSRGEILPVVLDFAAEFFSRVAILVVREEEVFAVAGRGVATLEVDPLETDSPISLPAGSAGWIRSVLESGIARVAAPQTEADEQLLACLGEIRPASAYLGPIESGGLVIAMIYGDQGATGRPLPETDSLEVVLQQAGLALDRAALQRALWEVDARTS